MEFINSNVSESHRRHRSFQFRARLPKERLQPSSEWDMQFLNFLNSLIFSKKNWNFDYFFFDFFTFIYRLQLLQNPWNSTGSKLPAPHPWEGSSPSFWNYQSCEKMVESKKCSICFVRIELECSQTYGNHDSRNLGIRECRFSKSKLQEKYIWKIWKSRRNSSSIIEKKRKIYQTLKRTIKKMAYHTFAYRLKKMQRLV